MPIPVTNHRDLLTGQIADRQHGQAHRSQLLAAGLSTDVIQTSLAAGRLRPVFPGTYAVGHKAMTTKGWCQAALLYCGEEAVLSHDTSTLLWGVAKPDLFPISVINSGERGRHMENLRVRRMALDPEDWVTHDNLRITTPARMIVDKAGELQGRGLRRLVERTQDANRFSASLIDDVLNRHPRRPGCASLRHLIELMNPDSDRARSYLERLFLRLVRGAGLPLPEVNQVIEGKERDFVWRHQRLVVETDGYGSHSSKAAIARDKRRDRELVGAHWRPIRFTYEEVAFEPKATMDELANLILGH